MDFDATANENTAPAFTFHGSYTRAVDAKGRFALPFRFRQGGSVPVEEKYVVSQGADGSLSLLPYAVWIVNFNRMRQGEAGPAGAVSRAFLGRVGGDDSERGSREVRGRRGSGPRSGCLLSGLGYAAP